MIPIFSLSLLSLRVLLLPVSCIWMLCLYVCPVEWIASPRVLLWRHRSPKDEEWREHQQEVEARDSLLSSFLLTSPWSVCSFCFLFSRFLFFRCSFFFFVPRGTNTLDSHEKNYYRYKEGMRESSMQVRQKEREKERDSSLKEPPPAAKKWWKIGRQT